MNVKQSRIVATISALIIAGLIIFLCESRLTYHAVYPHNDFADGWELYINQKKYENANITTFYKYLTEKLQRNDTVTMSHTLTDIGYIPFPVVVFKSRYTTLTCYLDGEEIYNYGEEMYEKNQFIGKNYHIISLPHDYAGKTLTFYMKVNEPDAFNNLEIVMFGNQSDVEGMIIHTHRIIIFAGMFLLIFGLSFLFITLLFISVVPKTIDLLLSSILCMNVGAWLLSYYTLLSFFMYAPLETEAEYFSMLLIVPFCLLILYFIQNIENKKRYFLLVAISSLLVIVQYVLHYCFNIHMRVTLPLYHINAFFGFGVVAFSAVKNIRKRDLSPSSLVQMVGLSVFTLSEMVHVILYYLGNYYIFINPRSSILIIASGCLFFALCQIANYLLFITESYARKKEFASLTHLAYADGLTNLPNRASADKLLATLDETDDDYCIISIDLNGLKTVNDKYGHLSGDKYIKDFSKVLTNTFSDSSECARIGGDEFLIIIRDTAGIDVNSLIDRMNSALDVMNAIYSEYKRSVATGYAFRHERPDQGSHEVYLLADQRMYQNKRKMHDELRQS